MLSLACTPCCRPPAPARRNRNGLLKMLNISVPHPSILWVFLLSRQQDCSYIGTGQVSVLGAAAGSGLLSAALFSGVCSVQCSCAALLRPLNLFSPPSHGCFLLSESVSCFHILPCVVRGACLLTCPGVSGELFSGTRAASLWLCLKKWHSFADKL